MFDQIEQIKKEYEDLSQKMQNPAIFSDPIKMQSYARRRAELGRILSQLQKLQKVEENIRQSQELLKSDDEQIKKLAVQDLTKLQIEKENIEKFLKTALTSSDPTNNKSVILEIRSGSGGDEAELFAAELARMYTRYAERKNWQIDIMNSNRTEIGGIKEIILEISGLGAWDNLKFESGVHRVQRVPKTEKSGRLHTSTATVAVLPEAQESDVQISSKDLKIEVFRARGHGGQSVNTTDSAVRITHLPSNIVVSCQDERSQFKNKLKAMKILRSRLLEEKEKNLSQERGETRRIQIGTGDRSEKIRTYNFPQNRVTDHRINFSIHNIEGILNGELDPLISKLKDEDLKKRP